jgi:monoamine oxidase
MTDAIVIGAGIAGLTAAEALLHDGLTVRVLEARDRVGGRLLNHELADGGIVEVGGQWIGPTQRRATALARRMGLPLYPTHATGKNLIEHDGTVTRYAGDIPKINPAVLADIGQARLRLNLMARRVRTDAPWRAPKAGRWDARTFEDWIARNLVTPMGRELLRLGCAAVWACEPRDVSLLHVLFYTRSAGRFEDLIGTRGGAQQDRVVGGSQLLATRLHATLPAGTVQLDAPVTQVVQDADGVEVHSAAGVHQARRVVVALSPALAGRLTYGPALPAARDQLTQRTPNGSVIKCMAVYDRPFWREQGLSGQAASLTGPARVVFDNSPHGSDRGVLLGFLEGREAREWSGRPEAERRAAVVAGFARLFGPKASRPIDYVDRDWSAETYTRGCYGGHLPPGTWTAFGPALTAPVGRVHWAGTETATTWSGYIDGAIESGERAAREVRAAAG